MGLIYTRKERNDDEKSKTVPAEDFINLMLDFNHNPKKVEKPDYTEIKYEP